MATFPDETNTGTTGTLRRSGSIDARNAGQVIEGLDITGYVEIGADNVTLRNCRVRATSWAAVLVKGKNATIESCEVLSEYATGGSKGVQFDGPSSGIVRKCNIHDCEDAIYIGTRNVTLEDNYIHDASSNGADPHIDGIQLHGGVSSDVTIRRNSVIMRDVENSAITTGVVQRVTIDSNHLVGGGYTVYVDARHGDGEVEDVSITNNIFGSHNYGCLALEECADIVVVTGNSDEAGNPIPGDSGEGEGGGEVDPPPEPEVPPPAEVAEMAGEIVVAGMTYDVQLKLTPQ